MEEYILVKVRESRPDFATGQYRVVLQDTNTGQILAIWVGQFEGNAIALALEEAWTPRPMTHDLLVNLFIHINATLQKVVITDLRDNTFYANMYLNLPGNEDIIEVDCRPSDAIAVALRSKAPIYVSKKLTGKMTDELDEIFDRLQPNDTIH